MTPHAGDKDVIVNVKYQRQNGKKVGSHVLNRTIKYVDATNGKDVATNVIQHVTYQRTAIIDQVTKAILGYDTNGDGKVDKTVSQAGLAWVASNHQNAFASQVSPDLTKKGYTDPTQPTVNALPVGPDADDMQVVVRYNRQKDSNVETRVITRTIKYVDAQNNDEVAPNVTETVIFDRFAVVDKVTKEIIGYDTNGDGQVDTIDGTKAWIAIGGNTWDSVASPDLSKAGYTNPSIAIVNGQVVAFNTPATIITVVYANDPDTNNQDDNNDGTDTNNQDDNNNGNNHNHGNGNTDNGQSQHHPVVVIPHNDGNADNAVNTITGNNLANGANANLPKTDMQNSDKTSILGMLLGIFGLASGFAFWKKGKKD